MHPSEFHPYLYSADSPPNVPKSSLPTGGELKSQGWPIDIPPDRGQAPEIDSRKNGALGAIRTPDPQIRSLMLYPAELRARTALSAKARNLVVSAQEFKAP